MIAKAKSISHGSISIDYITRLGEAEIICLNHLPSDVEPSAWYYHMMAHQKSCHRLARGRPLTNSIIRIEVSPTPDESKNYKQQDWEKLLWDTLTAMDEIKLPRNARRNLAKTNLTNSQFVATLHRDSKSGILHLHIDINRVDIDGNINDDSFIGRRAAMAANEVARQRGWIQAADKSIGNKNKISMDCYNVLRSMGAFSWGTYQSALEAKGYDVQIVQDTQNVVRGYTIRMGNSIYKASELGKSRNLTASKIESTWRRLHHTEVGRSPISTPRQHPAWPSPQHGLMTPQGRRMARPVEPQMTHRTIDIDDHNYEIDVPNKAMSAMKEEIASYQEPAETSERIADVALLLFANYIEAATSVAESGGGGSGSPAADWGRKRDEDEENWWRRCAWTAYQMVTTPKFKRGRGR